MESGPPEKVVALRVREGYGNRPRPDYIFFLSDLLPTFSQPLFAGWDTPGLICSWSNEIIMDILHTKIVDPYIKE